MKFWTPPPQRLQRLRDRGACFFFWPDCCCPGESLCYFSTLVGGTSWRDDGNGSLIFSTGSTPRRLRTDTAGYLYMARGNNIAKWSPYDPTLFSSQLWTATDGGADIEVTQDGTVYTIEGDEVFIYDGDGNPLDSWTITPPSWQPMATVTAFAIAVDTSGNIAVLANGGGAFIKLYNPSGAEQWEAGDPEISGDSCDGPFDFIRSELACDAAGNFYFAVGNAVHGACDASGSILWTETAVTTAVVTDATGIPYYSVHTPGDSYIVARDPSSGAEISRCVMGTNRPTTGLAHSRGHLYVSAYDESGDGNAKKLVFSGCAPAWNVSMGGHDGQSVAAHPGRAPLFQ